MAVRAPAGRKETADAQKEHAKVYTPGGIAVMGRQLANKMVSRILKEASQANKQKAMNQTPKAKAAAERLKDLEDMTKMKGSYKPKR